MAYNHGVRLQHLQVQQAATSMSGADLIDWSKAHNFPSSHNNAVLIEQAKTGRRVKVMNRGRRFKRNVNLKGHGYPESARL